jgi:hypothetical protein
VAPGRAEATPVAHLTLQSQPGDFIGQGGTFDITYTPINSAFFFVQAGQNIGPPPGVPTVVSFVLGTVTSGSDNTFTALSFGTNELGIPIQPGFYPNAEREPFASPGHPGLDVSFQNRGCNTLTGSFTVNHVSFSNPTTIQTFDATFQQHCEGAEPALFGSFTFDAAPALIPEPPTLLLLTFAFVGLIGSLTRLRIHTDCGANFVNHRNGGCPALPPL